MNRAHYGAVAAGPTANASRVPSPGADESCGRRSHVDHPGAGEEMRWEDCSAAIPRGPKWPPSRAIERWPTWPFTYA